jgi:hypothetical protein
MRSGHLIFLLLTCSTALPGCQLLASSATTRLAEDVSAAVLDQDDPEIVRYGGPSYLIALDGLIEGSPHSETLLLAGARLYNAYASAFVTDRERVKRMMARARGYGERAMCLRNKPVCDAIPGTFDEFSAAMAGTRERDLPALYGFGAAWAGWVQAHADDWSAVAEIPKIEALMQRVVEIDEPYEDGGAHLYLGVLLTQRPASLGGKPEEARVHFERAVELSEGRNLMAKVLYAQQYARLMFDRPLHDRLLGEVVAADPEAPGLTLSNTLAQERARVLLADADDYF